GTYAGGILLQTGANGTVTNNWIVQNGALTGGGGIYIGSASPTIANNTVADNTASVNGSPGSGEGVYIYGTDTAPASPRVENNIVASHTYGIWVGGNGATPLLSHNDVWNSSVANYRQVAPGSGDISTDPQFVNPLNDDYHLGGGSPVIDQGAVPDSPNTDIDGDSRPVDGNGDSIALPDIGADEMICNLPDFNGDGQVTALEVQAAASSWHLSATDPGFNPLTDRNGDGIVNLIDVMRIASAWGQSC
ncbi:MAG: hypothetical protein GXP41_02205, partial [Chloroflexi bacterium]|nr:hypothetical protein [Chloroflexota bacterium]